MNLKINIWTLNFLIQIWKLIYISIMKIVILIFKINILEFETWYLNLKFFDLNMIFSIPIQKDLFDLKIGFEF